MQQRGEEVIEEPAVSGVKVVDSTGARSLRTDTGIFSAGQSGWQSAVSRPRLGDTCPGCSIICMVSM